MGSSVGFCVGALRCEPVGCSLRVYDFVGLRVSPVVGARVPAVVGCKDSLKLTVSTSLVAGVGAVFELEPEEAEEEEDLDLDLDEDEDLDVEYALAADAMDASAFLDKLRLE